MFKNISSSSKEYVSVTVEAKKSGLVYNPTSDSVSLAFIPHRTGQTPTQPVSGDWKAASWDTDATQQDPVYTALCLIGPGSIPLVVLDPGSYMVWVRVTDSPEVPALMVDILTIT